MHLLSVGSVELKPFITILVHALTGSNREVAQHMLDKTQQLHNHMQATYRTVYESAAILFTAFLCPVNVLVDTDHVKRTSRH